MLIFWRGEPNYYWTEAFDREGLKAKGMLVSSDVYDMLVAILAQWKAGGFARAELSYDPRSDARASRADVSASAHHPALAISEDMIEALLGRELERGDYDQGIPHHIAQAT